MNFPDKDGWEPMEYAPTEEQIAAMIRAWKLWDADTKSFRKPDAPQ